MAIIWKDPEFKEPPVPERGRYTGIDEAVWQQRLLPLVARPDTWAVVASVAKEKGTGALSASVRAIREGRGGFPSGSFETTTRTEGDVINLYAKYSPKLARVA